MGAQNVLVLSRDLGDLTVCETVIPDVLKEFNRLDIFFNNHGIQGISQMARHITDDEFNKIMNINFNSAVILTRHALPELEKRDFGGCARDHRISQKAFSSDSCWA